MRKLARVLLGSTAPKQGNSGTTRNRGVIALDGGHSGWTRVRNVIMVSFSYAEFDFPSLFLTALIYDTSIDVTPGRPLVPSCSESRTP